MTVGKKMLLDDLLGIEILEAKALNDGYTLDKLNLISRHYLSVITHTIYITD